jgi:hypothetical protein
MTRIFALLAITALIGCAPTPPPLPSGAWYPFQQASETPR